MTDELQYLETVQNRDIVQLKTNSKSYGARLAPTVPVTLNDPEGHSLITGLTNFMMSFFVVLPYLTGFQLAVCMCSPAAVAELLVL